MRGTEIGMVLQGAARNLLPYLSARGNVAFAQAAARRRGREVPDARRGARPRWASPERPPTRRSGT